MSEQANNPVVEQPTAVQPVETPAQAASVQPSVDVSAATQKAVEAAERKAEAVFKSMLKQQGLEDAEALGQMLNEFKASRTTPEQELKAKNQTIKQLQEQLTSIEQQTRVNSAKDVVKQRLEAEKMHPDAAKLFIASLDAGKLEFGEDGKPTNIDVIVNELRQTTPGLFGEASTVYNNTSNPPKVEEPSGVDYEIKKRMEKYKQ